MTSILDSIDGALRDWETSDDAMRWSPRLAEVKGRAVEAAPPVTPASALRPAVSLGPGGPWLAIGSPGEDMTRLAIREQERQVREALMLRWLTPPIDGEFWPSPPVPVSGVLGRVPEDVMKACGETAVRQHAARGRATVRH